MQKQLMTPEFGPNAEPAKLTGNKEAQALAEKAKLTLSASEADALLLAQRNEVLDNAIERLGQNGENWVIGYLATRKDEDDHRSLVNIDPDAEEITIDLAKLMRDEGNKFCLVGAIGAEYGPHSYEAVDQAISAAASVLCSSSVLGTSYGFTNGHIYSVNDYRSMTGDLVVEAFRQAKSQPLRRD